MFYLQIDQEESLKYLQMQAGRSMGSKMFHLQMDREESLKHYVVNYELCIHFTVLCS